jgi:hypothetical protein
MQTIYKTASLGISELSGKVRYTQEHHKLATLKAQRRRSRKVETCYQGSIEVLPLSARYLLEQ